MTFDALGKRFDGSSAGSSENDLPGGVALLRFKKLSALLLALTVATNACTSSRPKAQPASHPIHSVPTSIPADCSRPVEDDINRFLATVPDGSTILFPAKGCYQQSHKFEVADRHDLIVDGNGSTFKSTSTKVTSKGSIDGNWVILRGHNITLKNMTSVGAFTKYDGLARSLATISPDPGFTEASMNYGLYGVDTVHLTDVNGSNPWGDGVTTGPSNYVDGKPAVVPKNVFVERVHITTTARHCMGLADGVNIWVQDSTCANDWYGGIDAEEDGLNSPIQGLHLINNTFDGFNTLGIFVPVASVASSPTKDIEIRGNRFLSGADTKCDPIIRVGGYPDTNPNVFTNVVADDNTLQHFGAGIVFDHVQGGSIQNNKLNQLTVPGSTPQGYCGTGIMPVVVTTSAGVVVANNGPA